MLNQFSHVRFFATPWTVACQAPLSMGFSRQKYWSGLSCPPPEDLPSPGVEPGSPGLQAYVLNNFQSYHQISIQRGCLNLNLLKEYMSPYHYFTISYTVISTASTIFSLSWLCQVLGAACGILVPWPGIEPRLGIAVQKCFDNHYSVFAITEETRNDNMNKKSECRG